MDELLKVLKSQTLGVGSYGAVYKAKCDQLLCAAKILHPTLFDRAAELEADPSSRHRFPMRRFQQECEILSSIRHPNVIQYLGTGVDQSTNLPVLFMDGSLTQFLENSHMPLPFHTEVSICHDISMALSFLHSNGIIHRDLSSNNVLMIGDRRAKVTDFGMAKLFTACQNTVTKLPGTEVYMPPEAFQDKPPNYTSSFDCFTFGVLVVQILTRQYPKPGESFNKVTRNGEELYEKATEIQRRSSHINLISPRHPLLEVALECIRDEEGRRLGAAFIAERISGQIMCSAPYTESRQRSAELPGYTTRLENLLQQNQEQIQQKEEQIRTLEERLQTQARQHNYTTDITMDFKEGHRAPRTMCRMSNAVVKDGVVYFASLDCITLRVGPDSPT